MELNVQIDAFSRNKKTKIELLQRAKQRKSDLTWTGGYLSWG